LVSANEKYEVDYLAKKFGLSSAEVKKAIEQKGPNREKVETHLAKLKKDAKK
jgi:Protein of unknown function (DUF3606)